MKRVIRTFCKTVYTCTSILCYFTGVAYVFFTFSGFCASQLVKLVQFPFYSKKWKGGISEFFRNTVHKLACTPILCYFTCVAYVVSMSFCAPPPCAKSWRRYCKPATRWMNSVESIDFAADACSHVRHRCSRFIRHHSVSSVSTLVRRRRWCYTRPNSRVSQVGFERSTYMQY